MHLDNFLFAALLLLLVTAIAVALSKQFGLGSALGLLIAGIVVGPHSPGLHVTEHVEDVRHFAELGVVLLLFLVGLEMQPGRLWRMRRDVFALGSLQILISGCAIALVMRQLDLAWPAAVLTGLGFALSSTALVVQLLQERGEMTRPFGLRSFSILLMQDLAVVPLLAAVPILSATGQLSADIPLWEQFAVIIGSFVLIWLFGHHLVPRVLHRLARQGNQEAFLLAVLSTVFLAAWAMHQAGMSMVMGAFIMGMLLSGSRYRLQIQATIEPYKGMLMSLFFVAVGMSIDIDALALQPGTLAQLTVAVILLKMAILLVLTLWFGSSRADATRIAFLLAQGGEFGFVLFGSALVLDVIDENTFTLAVGVISLTMLLTPLLMRAGARLAGLFESGQPGQIVAPDLHPDHRRQSKVIIGGYGRVGHTVAVLLHSNGIPFLAFDRSPERVSQGVADGFPVYFGDMADANLLDAAGVAEADLVVLTLQDSEEALDALSHIRTLAPDVPVISRARDLGMSARLQQAGANHAYPETLESSLRLGASALQLLGVNQDNIESLLSGIRGSNYHMVLPGGKENTEQRRTPSAPESTQ